MISIELYGLLITEFIHYYLTRAITRTVTGLFSPVQPGSEGRQMCAGEVGDEVEGQVWEELDRCTDPIEQVQNAPRPFGPVIDLFPNKGRNRIMVTPIQFKSAPSGYRISCLLHPAACDSTVTYCRGTGAIGVPTHKRTPPPFRSFRF